MTPPLDTTDRRILDLIQRAFPLVVRPFAWTARRCQTTERDVLARLRRLKEAGIIRDICAIFDSARVGYCSTLAAMAVEPARLEEVAAIVSAHPGVSHNYEREHFYNLWFTLTISGDLSLHGEVEQLARRARVEHYLVLPTLRRFKIETDFDLGTRGEAAGADSAGTRNQPVKKSKESVRRKVERQTKLQVELQSALHNPHSPIRNAVRQLQYDFPLVSRPFAVVAEKVGVSERELLTIARRLRDAGIMRRVGAILRHRQAGYTANGMVGWEVPAERIEEAGLRAAAERAVSHCYERPAFPPHWPYNLLTMIHGRREEDVLKVVARLLPEIQPLRHEVLFSRREFKKRRARYFESA
ncbi:MAG: Lrp/AsnC family transcriptional regulator [Candidatus Sumerlaeia bacterium]|nr:Lrp/AsnC family transcriptional regulator [Candidatus Sumerlaeia bacterium]